MSEQKREHITFTHDEVIFRLRLCPVCGYMIDVDADGVLHEHGTDSGNRCAGSGVNAWPPRSSEPGDSPFVELH
jgi:hypothetical protein